jgi:hypothetical protein
MEGRFMGHRGASRPTWRFRHSLYLPKSPADAAQSDPGSDHFPEARIKHLEFIQTFISLGNKFFSSERLGAH